MSTDQPTPGSGEEPPEGPSQPREDDPFRKRPPHPTPPGGPGEPSAASGGEPGRPFGEPSGAGGEPPYGRMPPPPAGGRAESDPLAGMPPLANRFKRLVARIIDALIVGIPLGLILGFAFGGYNYNRAGRSFWQELIYALVYFAYDGYMLTTRGQTFGKQFMKIRVAMLDNGALPAGQPGWTRAAVYALPPIVPCCGSLFWLVNVLWLLWDKPYQQALHDKAAKTVVVAAQ
ncbi:RDD family protein [Streptomyces silvisoli]|uniref:RDD family protein n=1 Tax=Streptomyces silvisoli TaxID=3034235 RepID=A0ABT5ZT70_9ACTN|nr:RDD family protein [Streptomyces silvisoli]MDF3292931.1 RDD family protein [Streptomyces silvisoli]